MQTAFNSNYLQQAALVTLGSTMLVLGGSFCSPVDLTDTS